MIRPWCRECVQKHLLEAMLYWSQYSDTRDKTDLLKSIGQLAEAVEESESGTQYKTYIRLAFDRAWCRYYQNSVEDSDGLLSSKLLQVVFFLDSADNSWTIDPLELHMDSHIRPPTYEPGREKAATFLAQAQILLNEADTGYPEHFFAAIACLAAASEEICRHDSMAAGDIRRERLALWKDRNRRPDLVALALTFADTPEKTNDR